MSLPQEERALLLQLIQSQRQAALATLHEGAPAVSMVAYVSDSAGGFLLHLSALSQHTGDVRSNARVSLLICQPDTGVGNPLTLHRVSIEGVAQPIARDTPEYAAAKSTYLARLPDSTVTFSLPDFTLFRIVPVRGRFIAGFARAYDVSADEMR